MTLVIESTAPGMRAPLSQARVQALAALVLAAESVVSANISITFLSERRMATMNREALGHTGATDIVTFELTRPVRSAPITADIYVCPAVARKNAAAWDVPVREEYARLVIHGTLHALGLEHPEGDARLQSPMWKKQEKYLRLALRRGIL
jgi:probable rRNA maturation factor